MSEAFALTGDLNEKKISFDEIGPVVTLDENG